MLIRESKTRINVLPNGVDHQVASWNMGVNNVVKDRYRFDDDRKIVISYMGDTIALLHQYDRHEDVLNFIERHYSKLH